MASTNYSQVTPNSSNFTDGRPIVTTTTIALGTPIGLLLALTYAVAQTVNVYSAPTTNFTKQSTNSTNYTPA